MEENNWEEKVVINFEFTEQKTGLKNDENVIDFRWSDVQEKDEEDIVNANFIECWQKQAN